jgi:hypothetical protein
MLHYPPVVSEVCKYCGAVVTLERQGDGAPFQGRLNYWYTSDHQCPESNRAIAEHDAERRLIEAYL